MLGEFNFLCLIFSNIGNNSQSINLNQLNGFQSTSAILNGNSATSALLTQSSAALINGQNKLGGQLNGHTNSIIEKPNYIALFDYESATKDDMTIKKNDQLIVIDKSHPDWWLAKNLRTKETGYVPYNYITSIDDLQIKEYVYLLILS